ncbi:MAG: pitrilysin family protein [Acidobacteriota bacterium]
MNRRSLLVSIAVGAALTGAALAQIPQHPKQLTYPALNFEVPKAEDFRVKLKTGQAAYVAEDHALPLVTVSITVRAGAWLDPANKPGVASLTGSMMRDGGTERSTAEQFDEEVDFLAADLNSFIGLTQGGASLNCLSKDLEKGLDLLFEMMTKPRFQADRLAVRKGTILEEMKQRNDDAGTILEREWGWLMYGQEHFAPREQTQAELDSITREDLINFHKMYWRPEQMIIAASGDLDKAKLIASLEKRFAAWKPTGPVAKIAWPPPAPKHTPKPGLYLVEKDIPQGKVYIGHLGAQRDPNWSNPDNVALQVMNDILGGGGFTSRITKRVRSDEGLAYSAGSRFGIDNYWPGTFRVSYQSKSPTVALAAKLSLEEIEKIRTQLVPAEELTTSKNSFVDTFPQTFQSKAAIVNTYAADEYIGRPHAYWQMYRDNMRKVTAEDVRRVAQQYLKPDQLVMLIVGKWSDIEPGDAGKRASMKELFGGKPIVLPLRDPLTLK